MREEVVFLLVAVLAAVAFAILFGSGDPRFSPLLDSDDSGSLAENTRESSFSDQVDKLEILKRDKLLELPWPNPHPNVEEHVFLPDSGEGDEGVIWVCTVEDLEKVRQNLNGHYVQKCDIEFPAGYMFKPIGYFSGNFSDPNNKIFTGIYNGNGYKIKFLNIDEGERSGVGLFAISKGIIKHIRLEDSSIRGGGGISGSGSYKVGRFVGSIVGINLGGYIRDVDVKNTEVEGDLAVGGLVGYHTYSEKYNAYMELSSFVSGHVSVHNLFGGSLVGVSDGGTISLSYSNSEVGNTGEDYYCGSYKAYLALGSCGGLVGYMAYSGLYRSFFIGTIGGEGGIYYAGGLVGLSESSLIVKSYSQGQIFPNYFYTGGLVGLTEDTSIRQSFSSPIIIYENDSYSIYYTYGYVGGLAGAGISSSSANSIISDSYSTGGYIKDKAYNTDAGGIIGYIIKNPPGYSPPVFTEPTILTRTYSSIGVSFKYYSGGLVGRNDFTGNIWNSFWDTQTSGQATSAGGTGKTTAEMKKKSTFTNWDFVNTWDIEEGKTYPYLRWELEEWKNVHYPFDSVVGGKTPDVSGRWPSAVLKNGAVLGAGKVGSGIYFGGNDKKHYVDTESDIELGPVYTISAWVRTHKNPGASDYPRIIAKEKWPDERSYALYINPNRKLVYLFNPDPKGAGTQSVVSNGNLNAWNWYHVAITYDSKKLRLYVNGKLDKETSASGEPFNNKYSLLIGTGRNSQSQTGFSHHFLGNIDDVRIYDRPLLEHEIEALYYWGW